jgi:Domain of unknown function (DUF4917)
MADKRALLLGNGFSRALDESFHYDSLYAEAKLDAHGRRIFQTCATRNFEVALRHLGEARRLASLYDYTTRFRKRVLSDSREIRSALIKAVTDVHPSYDDIPEDSFSNCRNFLSRFTNVYTVNYDLLPYWARLSSRPTLFNEGFSGKPLRWTSNEGKQSLFYLHGALHLFEQEDDIIKVSAGKSRYVFKAIRAQLGKGLLPLFVSEGTAKDKVRLIRRNPYFSYCYSSLRNNRMPLTIYGFAFRSQDGHIVEAIAKSGSRSLRVYLHTAASRAERERITSAAKNLVQRMKQFQGEKVGLDLLESDDVSIW